MSLKAICLKKIELGNFSGKNRTLNLGCPVWYFLISRRATVPGRYRLAAFGPRCCGAGIGGVPVRHLRGFRASNLPSVDLRAVCFVRAMLRQ